MRHLRILLSLLLFARPAAAADPLVELRNCTRIATSWADGDSFRIRCSDAKEYTIRLYGADCMEWHVNDETGARRLFDQRRYFGIAGAGSVAKTSISLARDFGGKAAARTAQLLEKPFTVHTAFANGRGDGRHERFYAFVTLADGRDLASVLVSEGLARAFGVCRETPRGTPTAGYRESLRDLELTAAKLGQGIWAATDWAALPAERQAQRAEEAEIGIASGPEEKSPGRILDPNTASRDDLQQLPGIGEATALRIIENRPYRSLEQLDRVPGIGSKTLQRILPFLRLGAMEKPQAPRGPS